MVKRIALVLVLAACIGWVVAPIEAADPSNAVPTVSQEAAPEAVAASSEQPLDLSSLFTPTPRYASQCSFGSCNKRIDCVQQGWVCHIGEVLSCRNGTSSGCLGECVCD